MTSNFKVSIIIPAYNSELFLERAIRSSVSQSLGKEKFEIIIINDGSKDMTKKICKNWKHEIVYIENKKNMGLPYSLNKGIKKAKGTYIARLDSDDFLHQDFLKILVLYLDENPKYQIVECDYFIYKKNSRLRLNQKKHPIGCANIIRKDFLVSIGLYNTKFKMAEELELRTRIMKNLIGYIDIPLYRYYKHAKNMTHDQKKYLKFKNKIKEHKSK